MAKGKQNIDKDLKKHIGSLKDVIAWLAEESKDFDKSIGKLSVVIKEIVDKTKTVNQRDITTLKNKVPKLIDVVKEADNSVSDIKVTDAVTIRIKLNVMQSIVCGYANLAKAISAMTADIELINIDTVTSRLKLIALIITTITDTTNEVRNNKSLSIIGAKRLQIQLKLLVGIVKQLVMFINLLEVGLKPVTVAKLQRIAPKMQLMSVIFIQFNKLIQAIKSTKPGLMMNRKLSSMSKLAVSLKNFALKLTDLVQAIDKRKLNTAADKLKLLQTIMGALKATIVSILVLAPLSLVFVALAPILIICFAGIALVLRALTFMMRFISSPTVFLAMGSLIMFDILLLVLAGGLLLLALMAVPLVAKMPTILLFMIELIAFVGLVVILGAILTLAAPILIASVLSFGLLALTVLAILFIAGMLWLLQFINLDVDAIRNNVMNVMNTASMVIQWALMPLDEELTNDGQKTVDKSVWTLLGNGLMRVFGAIAATASLVPLVIAVAAILFIAAMLRLLQIINLDPGRIYDNVNMVFDICNWILEFITTPTYVTYREEGKKDAITTLCGFVYKPLLKVIDGLFGAAGLVVMMFGVMAILLMATILRVLQTLELDQNQIMTNVDMVFQTCESIIDRIFRNDDQDKSTSERGAVGALVGFIYKPLNNVLESIFALAYLAVMVIAVICVLALAGMLRLIQNIEFDEGKINSNVEFVINTCNNIIKMIFRPDDEDSSESHRGGILGFIEYIGRQVMNSPITRVFDSIFALAYLAVMVIAIMCVLGIAGMLKLIQKIDLNVNKIQGNVKLVIDTTRQIISSIFKPDEENSSESQRGGILGFIEYIGSGLKDLPIVRVFNAILAMSYLAVMVIAILCVLGIALLIKQIGKIDPKVIDQGRENAILVMNVCQEIIDMIFKDDEANQAQSSRGGLFGFINWVSSGFGAIFESAMTIAYLALAFIAMSIVLGMVKMMKTIGEIDKTVMDNAMSNVMIVMATIDGIVNRVINTGEDKGSKPSNRGALLSIVEWVAGPQVADVIASILTIAHLALAFFAVYIVGAIAKSLESLGSIDNDTLARARENTDNVLYTASFIVDKLINSNYRLPEYKADSNMEKLMSLLLPAQIMSMAKALMTINALAFSELMIGALGRISESIGKVADVDVSKVEPAKNKAMLVIRSAGDIIKALDTDISGTDKEELKNISESISSLRNALQSILGINNAFKQLAVAPDYNVQAAYNNTINLFKTSMALADYIVNGEEDMEDVGLFGGWSKHFAKDSKLKQLIGILKDTKTILQQMSSFLRMASIVGEAMGPLSNIEFDRAAVTRNIEGIWDTVNAIITSQLNYFGVEKDAINDLQKYIKGQTSAITEANRMLTRTSYLFKTMQSLATWFPFLETMVYPELADTNIRNLFAGVSKVPVYAANLQDVETSWESVIGRISLIIQAIELTDKLTKRYVGMLPDIQNAFTQLTELDINDKVVTEKADMSRRALNNMFQIIQAASFQSQAERVRQNMDLMDRINESITSFTHVTDQDVRNSRDLTRNYIAFLTRVNSMDLSKLKTTEQLMKHWADMSRTINGNFEGLARSLNQHIAPALNVLNKTMDGVMKVQQEIIEELKKPVTALGGGAGAEQKYYKKEGDKYITVDSSGTKIEGAGDYKDEKAAQEAGLTKYEAGAPDTNYIEDDWADNDAPKGGSKPTERDFLHPYGISRPTRETNPLTRALDGNVIRVKIVN